MRERAVPVARAARSIGRRAAVRRIGALLGLALVAGPAGLGAAAPSKRVSRKPFAHPAPRAGITAALVLPVERLPEDHAVRAAYAAARAYPAIFDGLYCACRCSKSMGHRSLLSCFESEQPTGCVGCQDEAALAGKHAAGGADLDGVRAAIDAAYG